MDKYVSTDEEAEAFVVLRRSLSLKKEELMRRSEKIFYKKRANSIVVCDNDAGEEVQKDGDEEMDEEDTDIAKVLINYLSLSDQIGDYDDDDELNKE
ncbi:hypothetical protein S83_060650, partial [Arachis hypogaea]